MARACPLGVIKIPGLLMVLVNTKGPGLVIMTPGRPAEARPDHPRCPKDGHNWDGPAR